MLALMHCNYDVECINVKMIHLYTNIYLFAHFYSSIFILQLIHLPIFIIFFL